MTLVVGVLSSFLWSSGMDITVLEQIIPVPQFPTVSYH